MNIIEETKRVGLPFGEYLVIGSGILGALGIREIKDVDLLVTPKVFDELLKRGWKSEEIEIQGRVRQRLVNGSAEVYKDLYLYDEPQDVYKMIGEAEVIEGVPFMSLPQLLKMKQSLGRPKDLDDIELINKYLQNILFVL